MKEFFDMQSTLAFLENKIEHTEDMSVKRKLQSTHKDIVKDMNWRIEAQTKAQWEAEQNKKSAEKKEIELSERNSEIQDKINKHI